MKLKSVLLIDDDHTANVFHTVILRRSQISDQILAMETPEIALEHLRRASKVDCDLSFGQMMMPELIFLDVNMPQMTGYEFLEQFAGIYSDVKRKPVIYILTAATFRPEHDKFARFRCVKGILQKPLTVEGLTEIMKSNFNCMVR